MFKRCEAITLSGKRCANSQHCDNLCYVHYVNLCGICYANQGKNESCCKGKICSDCVSQVFVCPYCRTLIYRKFETPATDEKQFHKLSQSFINYFEKQNTTEEKITFCLKLFKWLFLETNINWWKNTKLTYILLLKLTEFKQTSDKFEPYFHLFVEKNLIEYAAKYSLIG